MGAGLRFVEAGPSPGLLHDERGGTSSELMGTIVVDNCSANAAEDVPPPDPDDVVVVPPKLAAATNAIDLDARRLGEVVLPGTAVVVENANGLP